MSNDRAIASTRIRVTKHVGSGFPLDEGVKLAAAVLQILGDRGAPGPREIELDFSGCPARLLISAFINRFLEAVYKQQGKDGLLWVRTARIVTDYDWQHESITRWIRDYEIVNTDSMDNSDWFSEWPQGEGFYFIQGDLSKSGSVGTHVCQVLAPSPPNLKWIYICCGAFVYPDEQPEDLLWWGPIPGPPPVPREAKVYGYGLRASQDGDGS